VDIYDKVHWRLTLRSWRHGSEALNHVYRVIGRHVRLHFQQTFTSFV